MEGDLTKKEEKAKAALSAYKMGQKKYLQLLENMVKPQFNKYDQDKSGAIDKKELGMLCRELG